MKETGSVIQWLRLALSKGPNRVGVSPPHPRMETDQFSETLCFLVSFWNTGWWMMDKVPKPSISKMGTFLLTSCLQNVINCHHRHHHWWNIGLWYSLLHFLSCRNSFGTVPLLPLPFCISSFTSSIHWFLGLHSSYHSQSSFLSLSKEVRSSPCMSHVHTSWPLAACSQSYVYNFCWAWRLCGCCYTVTFSLTVKLFIQHGLTWWSHLWVYFYV
jgi:hypothetical protein